MFPSLGKCRLIYSCRDQTQKSYEPGSNWPSITTYQPFHVTRVVIPLLAVTCILQLLNCIDQPVELQKTVL